MSKELDALLRNGTWDLVPQTIDQNLVGCKWVFHIKRKPDGSIDHFKARFVPKGFRQRPGINYHETFSHMVKLTTLRLILALAISFGWSLRQLDVNNAFFHGHLTKNVFMVQPLGFSDQQHPSHVCEL
ncbi:Retrovirus-related Pol polyprotein from transposon RE1 [Vitis vinifera]|uniref:Retrovirus-related Pol polyprotein from transposon RE1 n=1 Tax=Vitis vinifera TaxID=29760 RepID=A0A438DWQ0_VITVI|nr:Retrovirus-related Pol polyprotein from transposon RE1 [Vitis vinifera]